ncbi:MAG: tetratricopeptide repeat protein [Candidatus Electryonea clarkiae]|nr:tetratricopeptide repeat protein [Candidatus Electryonea clarkiae]
MPNPSHPKKRSTLQSPSSLKTIDHVILGALFETQEDYIRAIHQYNQALLYDSTSASLYISIAENYQKVGELESARLVLERGISHNGNDRGLLTQSGDLLFMMGRFDEAAERFEHTVEIYPDDYEAWYSLGSLYIRIGKHLDAVECYDRVMELNGPDMDILVRQATVLSLAKEYEKAIKAYERMYYLQPNDDLIPFTIGGLYLELGDSLRADSAFKMATELNPTIQRYWDLRIRLSVILRDTAKTINLIDEALNNNPESTELLSLSSSVYSQYERFDDAETYLLRAADLDSNDISHLINLGFLYHELKRWDDAEKIYIRALAVNNNDALLNNNYAYMLAEIGEKYDVALNHVNIALDSEPDNPSFLDTKGWLLYLLGDYSEAIIFLEKAASSTPDNPEILDHLGEVYFALGSKERAIVMWTRAIEQGGDEDEIRPKLAR